MVQNALNHLSERRHEVNQRKGTPGYPVEANLKLPPDRHHNSRNNSLFYMYFLFGRQSPEIGHGV
jgi:hypothetical protein